MSEAARVRLVRCPKCQNLLPELTDYSVYQCGGCDAVLRACKMNGCLETFSEKSEEERLEGAAEKLQTLEFSEKKMVNSSDGSESDVNSIASSSSRAERRRAKQDGADNIINLKSAADKWVIEEETEVDKNIDELSRAKLGKEFQDLKPQTVDANGVRRSGQLTNRRLRGSRGEVEGFQRAQRTDVERNRYSAPKYSVEGPSNYYYSDSSYGRGKQLMSGYSRRGFDRVEYAGEDRAEILRKIDELTHELSRSGEMAEKRIQNNPHYHRNEHHNHYSSASDSSAGTSHRPFMQYPFPDRLPGQAAYMSHYAEPSAYMNRHEMGNRHSFYPPADLRSHVQGVGDPLRSQLPMRGPQHAPAPFQEHPNQGYFSGQYMNNDIVHMSSFDTYPPKVNDHHLSCTCYNCNSNLHVTGQRYSEIPHAPLLYHHQNPGSLIPRDYGPRTTNMSQFQSHNLQSYSGWASELDSDVGSIVPRRQPPRVQLSNGQHWRPVAGGAPLVTCKNCFEVLPLPRKIMVQDSNQKKMRCGSCSTIIVFEFSNKSLLVSVHEAVNESTPIAEIDHKVKGNEADVHTQCRPNRASMTFSSEDYDHSGYDYQSLDRDPVQQLTNQPGSAKSAGTKNLHSTSSSTSEDETNLDPTAASRRNSSPTQLLVKGETPPPAGSSLQDYFEYSNKYHRGNRFGNGNRSRRSTDPDTCMPKKTALRQNSIKGASEATELDISSNEYGITGTSLESGEPSKESDQLRANKAAESFFAGIKKMSFRDANKFNQKEEQEKANVTVNGHLIPNQLAKKAEKVSGAIQPGHYWYDFRAGFWGVMGGPCLGIIPPFIEEFNYPMPENCAGGSTCVFVNGRELHQKDFDLLVKRGLPKERNRSYIIEISGRVLDEQTGEELESLGKLAPTVERVKHGFGMKIPKTAA